MLKTNNNNNSTNFGYMSSKPVNFTMLQCEHEKPMWDRLSLNIFIGTHKYTYE